MIHSKRMGPMNFRTNAVAAGTLLLGACGDITVPNYANPPLDDLLSRPTVELVKQTATGVMQGSRQDADTYVKWTGIVGREGYFLDNNETRYVTRIYNGNPQASNFTGNAYWTTPYRNIRTANLLIGALDHQNIQMSAAEEEAIRGFAKTIQAVDYIQVLNMRDRIPVEVNTSLDQLTTPPPLADRAAAYAFISKLLDDARGHLEKGGNSFPFPMPSGLKQFGFDTPARFIQLNRALKARVEVYRASEMKGGAANYGTALQALEGSFLSLNGAVDPLSNRALLNLGAYQTYSGGSGDTPNTLYDPSGKTVAERTLRRDVQLRASGERDARFVVKTDSASTSTVAGLSSDLRFAIYDTRPFYGSGGQAAPIPIIRNEELVLLRSEARWFTGDRVGAMADLNWVRVNSGGLAPIAQPTDDAGYVTALLRERRYSLLFEGGHRWVDNRRFGRIAELRASTQNTRGLGSVPTFFPLPSNETLPRS